ncbi:unnamed protein product [Pipistrellus nathusii]|uniref:Lipocalin/cytosolic fatty-acid binding domain-containing protein n=1 Tax=Pipistrellus nathusii TaxID=59473 RepID=A0ABN9Z4X3_PIPNA
MRCLLLALCVALVCGAQDLFVPQTGEDLDVQKMAGTWYSVAMAASDLALLSTQSAPLRLYVQELRPTAQADMELMMHRWEDGSCVQTKILAEKTEVPTEFKINSLGDSKVHVLDTDYENFAFLCLENAGPSKQSLACQYLARTPKVNKAAMEQFNEAMKLLPIHIQMVFTPAHVEERCRM